LVTICVRGGSKGLPGKHLKILHGKPLIQWTIEHALDFTHNDEDKVFLVSTDCEDIKKYLRDFYGNIPVLDRPSGLATDNTPKLDVIRHAHTYIENLVGSIDAVVDLDATAPIRKHNDLDICLGIFKKYNPPTLFSVVKSRKNPYFNQVEKDKGILQLCKRGHGAITDRQSCPRVYDLNASIYIYSRDFLLSNKNRIVQSRSSYYSMPEESSYDIDTELDFKINELIMRERNE